MKKNIIKIMALAVTVGIFSPSLYADYLASTVTKQSIQETNKETKQSKELLKKAAQLAQLKALSAEAEKI